MQMPPSLDWLDHHCNYIGVVSSNGFDGSNVVKRRTHKAAEQRLKARVDLAVTRGSKGRHGAAMKTALDHDDGWRFDAFVVALSRASLMATSFASAPELLKNTLSMPERSHRRLASLVCSGIS